MMRRSRSTPALELGDDLLGEQLHAGLGFLERDATEAERRRRLEIAQQLAPGAVLLDDLLRSAIARGRQEPVEYAGHAHPVQHRGRAGVGLVALRGLEVVTSDLVVL